MNPAVQQFVSVALPIMVTLVATIWIAQWSQNKRFDDLNRRFDDLKADMNWRFDDSSSDSSGSKHSSTITKNASSGLEERTSPVRRG
jgi:hypothetical protein